VGHDREASIGTDPSKSTECSGNCRRRPGEVDRGEFPATEAATRKLVAKLAAKYKRLTFRYEAGPTGHGL